MLLTCDFSPDGMTKYYKAYEILAKKLKPNKFKNFLCLKLLNFHNF